MAGRIEFVHDAVVRCAAILSSPVEITGCVEDHTCGGVTSVPEAGEDEQHGEVAGRIQLVYHATAHSGNARTAPLGCAVEITGRVEDHTFRRPPTIGDPKFVQLCGT